MEQFVLKVTSESSLHEKITLEFNEKLKEKELEIKNSQISKLNAKKDKILENLKKENITLAKKNALKEELQDLNADLGFLKTLTLPPEQSNSNVNSKEEMLDEQDSFTDIKQNTWQADRYLDDGDELSFKSRLENWAKTRSGNDSDIDQEIFKSHPIHKSGNLGHGVHIPGDVYHRLFKYQKTCVKWLLELHHQEVGGIIGDEMGLGKTIQVIAFLAALSHSRKLEGPVLIVSPATIMKQWVQEFHEWWPPLRVVVLHNSGSGMFKSSSSQKYDVYSSDDDYSSKSKRKSNDKSSPKVKKMIDYIVKNGHVIITTYEGLRSYRADILPVNWAYAFLDEGHKIRNPDADITITAKQVRTCHRIILSGTPIQNNLIELWSLYDFVFPGRLGTLPVFQAEFAIPISHGGYANASVVQVRTAHKCAAVLKDLISPYLIQRLKRDVAASLPKKTEQVLFCRLTDFQKKAYKRYLASGEVGNILHGQQHALSGKLMLAKLKGIDILRKICNHPDLLSLRDSSIKVKNYGDPERSGKMKVVQALLPIWKGEGHKVLLFCQTRQMQDIIEEMIRNNGYRYLRMDGTTPIKDRSELVDKFNESPDIFIFLLTTKVGGLGINLTGANRIILYDPDWNPASDSQARERAWRLGQKRDVTIYRLMVSGTIEEKIYQRQIFKEFLSQKILQDPKQRRFFKSNDLHDLFTLGNQDEHETETSALFGEDVNVRSKSKDDLTTVEGVSKIEEFKAPTEDVGENADEDSRILDALFSSTGVHSALKHDAIVSSSSVQDIYVEKEASKVAKEAALALRRSRKRVRGTGREEFAPTWTGKNGTVGAPSMTKKARPTFGKVQQTLPAPQKSSIIRNLTNSNTNYEKSVELIAEIQSYLLEQPNHSSPSSELIKKFNDQATSMGIPVFRQLLKEISTFSKQEDHPDGIWILKEEFI